MLAFLKRMKLAPNNSRGRFVNIIVSIMQLMPPIISLVCLMISITQEKTLGMITKDYVTLAFILSIDNIFSGLIPAEIKKNREMLNASGLLKMGKDNNNWD